MNAKKILVMLLATILLATGIWFAMPTSDAQLVGKSVIVQGFILVDVNSDNVLDEVHVDYQLSNGKAGTIIIPADSQIIGFFQKAYTAVKPVVP